MIRHYKFNYDLHEAEVCFKVDTSKFNTEMAQANLDFFLWDYDKEADPIDEVMKKYAMEAIRIATTKNYNRYGVQKEFENLEGFLRVDGIDSGIELKLIRAYEFDDDKLDMTVVKD